MNSKAWKKLDAIFATAWRPRVTFRNYSIAAFQQQVIPNQQLLHRQLKCRVLVEINPRRTASRQAMRAIMRETKAIPAAVWESASLLVVFPEAVASHIHKATLPARNRYPRHEDYSAQGDRS